MLAIEDISNKLTLKVVSESTSVPFLVFLGFSVLDLPVIPM